MEPLGSFPRVHNVLPREKIEGPQGIFQGKPEATSKARPKAKTLGACGPKGFWPLVWPRIFGYLPFHTQVKGLRNLTIYQDDRRLNMWCLFFCLFFFWIFSITNNCILGLTQMRKSFGGESNIEYVCTIFYNVSVGKNKENKQTKKL